MLMNQLIHNEITNYVSSNNANRRKTNDERYFDEPLVGFAAADDPLFEKYKDIIGEFHMTPKEFFELEYGPGSFTGGTVICWILPITRHILDSNRAQDSLPSLDWAHTRRFGEAFNNQLRIHLISFLKQLGYRSAAPLLSEHWKRVVSPKIGHASNWSERHAAYITGLGTFGLSDGLITAKGMAHRCGSIITELVLEPSERPYNGPYDYCLFYNSNRCGVCMKRCPANAISPLGHDKDSCFQYIRNKVMPTVNEKYGVDTPSCGLCQTNVPCERQIPLKGSVEITSNEIKTRGQ